MLYGVMYRNCEVTDLQSFTAPYASMAHDFMVTRRHVLFPVTPLALSVERAMRGKPLLAWDANKRTHVGVMQRGGSTDTLRWFQADACHVFHVLNAWDNGDTLVAYVMQSETAPGLPDAEGRPGDPEAMAARLCRWTFDLADTSAEFRREYLDDLVAEFPRIDERYAGRRNRMASTPAMRRRARRTIRKACSTTAWPASISTPASAASIRCHTAMSYRSRFLCHAPQMLRKVTADS